MKKILSFLFLIALSMLLLCVATTEVKANTWYHESADRAGNPIVLEDDQYFQGISVNSHIMSDLTFMEINFSKYLNEYDLEVSILGFAEAFYIKDGEVAEEIAMYVYLGMETELYIPDRIQVEVSFKSQKCLYGTEMVETLDSSLVNKTYLTQWVKVNTYDSLVKYCFSSFVGETNKKSMTDWLINDYASRVNLTEVNTIFNTRVKQFNIKDTVWNTTEVYNRENSAIKFYEGQEFQFVSQRSNPLAEAGIMMLTATEPVYERTTACVAINENTVTVKGEAVRYRYRMHNDIDLDFLSFKKDTEFIDLYYLFFNVFENFDNSKWGTEKYITEVNLNYILGECKDSNFYVTIGIPILSYEREISLLNSSGEIVDTIFHEGNDENKVIFESTRTFVEQVDRKELWINQTVTPETITFEYMDESINNAWVAFTTGVFDSLKTTYLTLFNTDSEEFKNIMNQAEEYDSYYLNNYQFGLVFGDKNGYSVTATRNIYPGHTKDTVTSYLAAVVGLTDITYKENGEIFKVTVSESRIDNSGVAFPQKPSDDPFKEEAGDGIEKKDDGFWGWIQDIIDFFTKELPEWWAQYGVIVIGAAITLAVVVIAIVIGRAIHKARLKKALMVQPKEPKPKNKKKE